MRVRALGHAGLEVTSADSIAVVDPWLTPEGAFQASWFPFPDNGHLRDERRSDPSVVVLSHEHLDHVDPWFLSSLPSSIPIVGPRYPSPALATKVARAGHSLIELSDWERFDVGDVSVFFVSEPSPMNHDSVVVVTTADHSLLDLNDARLTPMQLRRIRQEIGGVVDVLAIQGAGASWYPICYRYPAEQVERLSREKRHAKLAYVRRVIEVVEPRVTLPFAGPPCFLDPDLFRHNAGMDDGIFPDQRQVEAWLGAHGVSPIAVLLPGEEWDADRLVRLSLERWAGFWQEDRAAYLEDYASRAADRIAAVKARFPTPTHSLAEPFHRYLSELVGLSPYFNERIGMRVGFEVTGAGGGEWAVDFRPGREDVGEGVNDCGYVFRFDSRWLRPILEGAVAWEDFLLSLRFEARRDPDLYNDHLLGLLKFADTQALDAVESFERSMDRDTRITVEFGGQQYSIGRYCPHAASDLLDTGMVLPNGSIRCLAHHYEFSLETGECLNGNCPPIVVEPSPRRPT